LFIGKTMSVRFRPHAGVKLPSRARSLQPPDDRSQRLPKRRQDIISLVVRFRNHS
jgi:hypothetical protein